MLDIMMEAIRFGLHHCIYRRQGISSASQTSGWLTLLYILFNSLWLGFLFKNRFRSICTGNLPYWIVYRQKYSFDNSQIRLLKLKTINLWLKEHQLRILNSIKLNKWLSIKVHCIKNVIADTHSHCKRNHY